MQVVWCRHCSSLPGGLQLVEVVAVLAILDHAAEHKDPGAAIVIFGYRHILVPGAIVVIFGYRNVLVPGVVIVIFWYRNVLVPGAVIVIFWYRNVLRP